MSAERIAQAKEDICKTSAFKTLSGFFDEDTFFEIDPFTKSEDTYAEVVAGYGMVEGLPVYAFAQNNDMCAGAMSKAQAAKLKKLYDLALKTGAPIVGFYDSIGGRLRQGNALLAAYGTVLNLSGNLSGVVPQISVVLGTCLGTSALTAVNADFVIMTKKAQLSLDVQGNNADAEYNSKKGIAALVAKDNDEAVMMAKQLVTMLPSNNLSPAPATFECDPSSENTDCMAVKVADADSVMKMYADFGNGAGVSFARINGNVVGIVGTKGGEIDCPAAKKGARFVRFCDAFSIPVITFVNSKGFASLRSASKVACAYAEATTVKISVITGTAIGSVYVAMAGESAACDITLALDDTVISPINIEAAAAIIAPEKMNVPIKEQASAAMAFAKENLGSFEAAQNGYVQDVVSLDELRAKLIYALDMLSSKRVPTLAKKHSTI